MSGIYERHVLRLAREGQKELAARVAAEMVECDLCGRFRWEGPDPMSHASDCPLGRLLASVQAVKS